MTSYLLKLRLPATSLVRAAPLINNQHVLRNLSLFETPFSMNITRDYVHSIEPSSKAMKSLPESNLEKMKPKTVKTKKKKESKKPSLFKERIDYNKLGLISLGKLMMVLEDTIIKSITQEHYMHGPGFVQVWGNDEWKEELKSIVPRRTLTLTQDLQGECTSLFLPLTYEGLKDVLSCYDITDEETIKSFWDLIQKYLMKDGKLEITELFA